MDVFAFFLVQKGCFAGFMCVICLLFVMEVSEKSEKHVLSFPVADVCAHAGMESEYVRIPINRTASLSFSVKITLCLIAC